MKSTRISSRFRLVCCSRRHMQFTHTVNLHIQSTHTVYTYSLHIQSTHTVYTYSLHIQSTHTVYTYSLHIQSHTNLICLRFDFDWAAISSRSLISSNKWRVLQELVKRRTFSSLSFEHGQEAIRSRVGHENHKRNEDQEEFVNTALLAACIFWWFKFIYTVISWKLCMRDATATRRRLDW
jgi:hypothetical protein